MSPDTNAAPAVVSQPDTWDGVSPDTNRVQMPALISAPTAKVYTFSTDPTDPIKVLTSKPPDYSIFVIKSLTGNSSETPYKIAFMLDDSTTPPTTTEAYTIYDQFGSETLTPPFGPGTSALLFFAGTKIISLGVIDFVPAPE